jgi:predicted outer membrane repeat protein
MKKITLLLALVCSMSLFATRYLVQSGAPGSATWRAATGEEVLVDLTVNGQTLNAWLTATFASFPEGDEIWIAAGTYQVAAIFNIPANFKVYGGFAGTEATIADRAKGANAWDFSNETIIDGNNAVAIFGCASNRVALFDGLTLTKGYISGNSAAITVRPGVVVQQCKFLSNVATGQGGAILMNGGGEVYNSYFYDNAANMGGAVHLGGTGASVVSGCLFDSNKAITGANKQGGALRSQSSLATISNCIFRNNEAASNGSAVYTQVDIAAANKIINCVFYGNKTKSALYLRGGAVYNSTIANNDGGAVYIATKDGQVYNSAIWGETRAKASVSGVNVAGVEFKNNASVTIPAADLWITTDNVQLDTLATEPAYPHFANIATNDWSLTYQSPMLNAGNGSIANVPVTDINGLARPQGSAYDAGAYELQYYNTTVTFNAGGQVNALASGAVLSEPKGKPLVFNIIPASGQSVASVKYNDVEVKDEVVSGVYTAPALAADATLVVEFSTTTSVNELRSGLMVFASAKSIEIRGLEAGETVTVYHMNGARMFHAAANGSEIAVPASRGIYLVKVADNILKVIVQ